MRIEGTLTICGANKQWWVQVQRADGQPPFVLGLPGEGVVLDVVSNTPTMTCPRCKGKQMEYFTPVTSIVPTQVDFCLACKGRGFIPCTEEERDET